MSGNYVGFGADDIVAAGPGKLSADARLRSKVPDFDGPIVAAADDLVVVTHELGGQDLSGMAGESMA